MIVVNLFPHFKDISAPPKTIGISFPVIRNSELTFCRRKRQTCLRTTSGGNWYSCGKRKNLSCDCSIHLGHSFFGFFKCFVLVFRCESSKPPGMETFVVIHVLKHFSFTHRQRVLFYKVQMCGGAYSQPIFLMDLPEIKSVCLISLHTFLPMVSAPFLSVAELFTTHPLSLNSNQQCGARVAGLNRARQPEATGTCCPGKF